MRLRGEFRFQNGLIIPNNVTIVGAGLILDAALRGDALTFWVGLCNAVFEPELRIEDIEEPTLATNGYARQAVSRDLAGWPGGGEVNGESYRESLDLVWAAVGGPYDQAVTRMFLCQTESDLAGDIIALSAPVPDEFVVDVDTPLPDRTFKYRLYMR